MITQEKLKQMFDYADGQLIRKQASYKHPANVAIGSKTIKGIETKIQGKFYRLHRLIYLYHHGYMPEQIDHINRNVFDNRIENLRPANSGQNASNRKIFSNNKSGLKGVCWHKHIKKWGVSCSVNGKQKHYGYFGDLLSAASKAFAIRTQLHGQFANHF